MRKNEMQTRENKKVNPIQRVKDPVIYKNVITSSENIYTPIIATYGDSEYAKYRKEKMIQDCNNPYNYNCDAFVRQVFQNRVEHTFNCVLAGLEYITEQEIKNTNVVFFVDRYTILKDIKEYPYQYIFNIESYIDSKNQHPFIFDPLTRMDVEFSILTLLSNNIQSQLLVVPTDINEELLIEATKIKNNILVMIKGMLSKMFDELLVEANLAFSNAYLKEDIPGVNPFRG